jgi:cytochrome c oxidase cbb3-type subunit III
MKDEVSNGSTTPQLREHVYDGIQEYDQKLPNWWLWTFYLAIIGFFAWWLMYYSAGWFEKDGIGVDARIAEINEKKAKELEAMMATLDNSVLWKMSRNPLITGKGKATFEVTCVACHGKDLSATMAGVKLTGEALNDSEWKYGANPRSGQSGGSSGLRLELSSASGGSRGQLID